MPSVRGPTVTRPDATRFLGPTNSYQANRSARIRLDNQSGRQPLPDISLDLTHDYLDYSHLWRTSPVVPVIPLAPTHGYPNYSHPWSTVPHHVRTRLTPRQPDRQGAGVFAAITPRAFRPTGLTYTSTRGPSTSESELESDWESDWEEEEVVIRKPMPDFTKHTKSIKSPSEPSIICTICLEDLLTTRQSDIGDNALIQLNTCKHEFHTGCIITWFTSRTLAGGILHTCPTCRAPLIRKS